MRFLRVLAIGALVALGAGHVGAEESSKPVQAIWKPQEIVFYFQSFTTFYSCGTLEDKLEQILGQVGAQAEVRVRAPGCGSGPVSSPRAEIRLISPVEATAEALAEAKKGESTRELVARLAGDRARAAELKKKFPAQWQRVTIGRGHDAPSVAGGDCELLEQVRRKILPQLAVRVIEGDTPCPPNPSSLHRPNLVVDALIEMPKPDEAPSPATD